MKIYKKIGKNKENVTYIDEENRAVISTRFQYILFYFFFKCLFIQLSSFKDI